MHPYITAATFSSVFLLLTTASLIAFLVRAYVSPFSTLVFVDIFIQSRNDEFTAYAYLLRYNDTSANKGLSIKSYTLIIYRSLAQETVLLTYRQNDDK